MMFCLPFQSACWCTSKEMCVYWRAATNVCWFFICTSTKMHILTQQRMSAVMDTTTNVYTTTNGYIHQSSASTNACKYVNTCMFCCCIIQVHTYVRTWIMQRRKSANRASQRKNVPTRLDQQQRTSAGVVHQRMYAHLSAFIPNLACVCNIYVATYNCICIYIIHVCSCCHFGSKSSTKNRCMRLNSISSKRFNASSHKVPVEIPFQILLSFWNENWEIQPYQTTQKFQGRWEIYRVVVSQHGELHNL